MASTDKSDLAKSLVKLQLTFKLGLEDKIIQINGLWGSACATKNTQESLSDLHRMAHSLAGAGGTFGAMSVSTVARELEQLFKTYQDSPTNSVISECGQQKIERLLVQLKTAADDWQPSNIPFIQPIEVDDRRDNNLIYLAEDDELLGADLAEKLSQADFRVKHFAQLEAFEAAFDKEVPAAIIMDIVFKEGDVAGADVIQKITQKLKTCPPVVFISVRDDIEVRLAAARAGARRYFCKPLNIEKLTNTLNGLTAKTSIKPYSVLLIDDDQTLLDYYSIILKEAGMSVKALNNPFDCLTALSDFKPDIIVLDVYMPGCSGPELAQVIRQDDVWALTPIMFLSSETDLNRQLAAMDLGGDDFLVKPVDAEHLVAAIIARAKRARWTNRLNKDLLVSLRESEFRLVTMDQHNIVSSTDTAGRIIDVNQKFCEISGYRKEELLGKNHRILKSGYHSKSFYKEMWQTISQGKVWHGTVCNRNKNGEEYWVESTIVPFLDEKGKPYKYVSTRTDITALRQSEERMRRSQEFANIGTWDWNIKTGQLHWSDSIWPLFGYEKDKIETTYENFLAAIHPDDRELVIQAVNSCVEHGTNYNIEHRVVWPDGTIRWLHESGNVVRNEDGEATHMLGVVQDITERLEAENQLRESEERFVFAVEGAGDGVWDWNIKTNEVQFSKNWIQMLGYNPGELRNNFDTFLDLMQPDDRVRAKNKLDKYLSGKIPVYAIELKMRCKDGSYKWILSRGKVMKKGGDEKPLRMIGIHNDITKRKQVERDLVLARKAAEAANKAKSIFLSNMSHELRTPMNAIMGYGQLLKLDTGQPLTSNQEESVDEILNASKHLLELINEILDLAKIEEGAMDLALEDTIVEHIIIEALNLMNPLAKKRGIKIQLSKNNILNNREEFVEQCINKVKIDRIRFKQIMLNLLSNAVKYNSENGVITIDCQSVNNQMLRISVTDTGPGLSEDMQARLFTSFERLDAEERGVEGTGIGLVITKKIVEMMNGEIGVSSRIGEGSTFWVEFPRLN